MHGLRRVHGAGQDEGDAVTAGVFMATRDRTVGDAVIDERHHYRLRLAVEGRIRFLSHLETVDVLLSSLRRAGVTLALSQGMRPKPLIKVAMPRPVGVEAWEDIVEVELAAAIDPDQLALNLVGVLPRGLVLLGVERLVGRYSSAASRVVGATYRLHLNGATPADVTRAVDAFLTASSVEVRRVTPKRTRMVDVRSLVGDVAAIDGEAAIRAFLRLDSNGSARPQEVALAIARAGELPGLSITRVIRESIALAAPGEEGHTAEPALVGADVPEGPEKPWGAC